MTTSRRSEFAPVVLVLLLTGVTSNACGSTSADDSGSSSGKGAVLSGGTGNSDGCGKDTDCTAPRICENRVCVNPPSTGGAGGTSGGSGGAGGSTGGKGGSAGAPGTGGTATGGKGGTGGSSGSTTPGGLGDACKADGDCASGLTCVPGGSTTLGGGSPPHGLCTLQCAKDTDCTALEAGAYCVAFDANSTVTYCLEGCSTGAAGVPKCHERTDVSCSLLGLADGTVACTSSDACATGQLCDTDNGVCGDIVTGCLPTCGGDFDCTSGEYCDYSTGWCMAGKATGQAIGTACDPNAATDPCIGFCAPVDDMGTLGMCSGFCSLNPDLTGCGWDGTTTANAGCLFGTVLSGDDVAPGDVGICGALCDCNSDCTISTERCVDESGGTVMQIWGRKGYCRPLQTGETDANTFACN